MDMNLNDQLGADLIIDATVSRSVTRMLDIVAQVPGRLVSIAQVATDVRSGALGMLIVSNLSIEPLGEPDAAERDGAAAGQ